MAGPFEAKINAQAEKFKQVKSSLPFQIANAGQNYFSRSFQASKWDGKYWDKRQTETKKSEGKHLLVASGRLRASIFHCIRKYSWDEIVWGTDVPYAKVHNEGFDGEVSAHSRTRTITKQVSTYKGVSARGRITRSTGTVKIKGASHNVSSFHRTVPKRQFMGFTDELMKIFRDKINKAVGDCFK